MKIELKKNSETSNVWCKKRKKRNTTTKSMCIVKERKGVEVKEGKVNSITAKVVTKKVKMLTKVVKI